MQIDIRVATDADFPAIQGLLSSRGDGRTWSEEDMRWLFYDLDPDRCIAWLAWDGERPVAYTSMFLRNLQGEGQQHRVGYWTNLYIDPEYGQYLLYPQMPRAMIEWIDHNDVAFLYAAVRRQRVARAHLAIGFAKCGDLPVLARPIRPARLLSKHKKLGQALQLASAPLDAAFWLAQSSRRLMLAKAPTTTIAPDSESASQLVEWINARGQSAVAQRWSASSFLHRYCRTAEGENYQILVAGNQDHPRAAVIYRFTTHGANLRVCVIMDFMFADGCERCLLWLLETVAAASRRDNCDLVLVLAGVSKQERSLLHASGFRATSEKYELILWPGDTCEKNAWAANSANWRFGFGDHDAF